MSCCCEIRDFVLAKREALIIFSSPLPKTGEQDRKRVYMGLHRSFCAILCGVTLALTGSGCSSAPKGDDKGTIPVNVTVDSEKRDHAVSGAALVEHSDKTVEEIVSK